MQDIRYQTPTTQDDGAAGGSGSGMPFEGFDPPESNFWRLPNNWFDLAARFTSWGEHKVVEYILRHTWGYHEYGLAKLITMDEFMHGRKRRDGTRIDAGCGMAENSIKKGIQDAVTHGFLIVQTDDSDKGRIKKYYAPRMRRPLQDEGEHSAQPGGRYLPLESQSLTPGPQHPIPGVPPMTLSSPSVIPSRTPADPPTEQKPVAIHHEKETHSNKPNQVVCLPQVSSSRTRRVGHERSLRPTGVEVPSPQIVSEISDPRQHNHVPDQVLAGISVISHGPSRREQAGSPVNLQASGSEIGIAALSGSDAATRSPGEQPPFRADLVRRLMAEGIAAARARVLVNAVPAERIERQLSWIEYRACRDRAATLVRAITEDFSEPARRFTAAVSAGSSQSKYYKGSYALCPRCGSRPCVAGCPGPNERGGD